MLFDLGVHNLDRALYLMGYPQPVTVTGASFGELGAQGQGLGGWGSDILKPGANVRFDVDDLSWAFVRFANGAVLQFEVAWAAHGPDQFFTELLGTKGGAHVGSRDKISLYTNLNGQKVTLENELPNPPANSYQRLVENFVRYIGGDVTAEIVTPEQALVSVKIVDALQRSAQGGREVVIGE